MKKTLRILLPIVLALCILAFTFWYLFVYDREFTRDMLISCARYSESNGNYTLATWFYNLAYDHTGDIDAVAIALADQYKRSGNYTKAEYTLSKAISDGAGIDVYIALCKTYVQQDKLLDAVTMLDCIKDPEIKSEIDKLRPAAPTCFPEPGFYNQYISVSVEGTDGELYVSGKGGYPSVSQDRYKAAIALTDGDNSIYAVVVGKDGLVSPLTMCGYTIGGVIEQVNFSDPAVEAEIRKILNVPADKVLYTNDLWTITEFTVPDGAQNYSDLKNMVFLTSLTIRSGVSAQLGSIGTLSNLETLVITDTTISAEDLSAFGQSAKLTSLTLSGCNLSNISSLEKLTELTYLDLSNNAISQITALSAMTKLTEVNLQNNAISSASPLSAATSMKKLNISSNALISLSPIAACTALTDVDAGTNNITDLGSMNKLTKLTSLSLANNKLTDVSAISGCTALKTLNISGNTLTSISMLAALINMEEFDFSYNEVTALPTFPKNCELVTITGSNNKLSSLDPLAGLVNLNRVNMDYNADITSVSALKSCRQLVEVNVYATKVTNVRDLTDQSVIVNYNPVQ